MWGLPGTMRDYVGGFRGAGGMVLMWSLGFGVFACMAGVVWRATVLSGNERRLGAWAGGIVVGHNISGHMDI